MELMRFEIKSAAIPQKRHRTSRGVTYNPQAREKKAFKWLLAAQMRERGYSMVLGPVRAEMTVYRPVSANLSKEKKAELLGTFVDKRPDNDNYEKFYYDVLSGIAYPDDGAIAVNWTQKVYAEKAGVVIEIYPAGGNTISEHAITYQDNLTLENLNSLIKKANRLGMQDRMISRVYSLEDAEGIHLYFDVEGPTEKTNEPMEKTNEPK